MGRNYAVATATLDDRGQRAALRDGVLECGRLIGWATRTTIVFAERLARRPWKRCTPAELTAVLTELRTIRRAYAMRRRTPPAHHCARRALRAKRRNGHANSD